MTKRTNDQMKNTNVKFWNRHAAKYAERPVADQAVYEKKLAKTQSYLKPTMQLLEFGCGTGSTALIHAPHVKHIRATDISINMIEIAKDKAKKQGITNIDFEVSSIDELVVKDASLDAVLGLSILHLLKNKDSIIQRVYQMLKPGGVFITSTACLEDSMKFLKWIGPIGHVLGLLPTVNVFTVQQLEQSMLAAGFKIDHQWQPGKGKSVFMVAKKPERTTP